ncbi:hypothetical protein FOA43_004645 [Brettanomyces nanus]|uniref:Endonuclease/exonuclease/phosphatase domain-containing protein n=1 Tax=Eeniella nana TaxID=13502 RepID=A0A875S8K5_EENNA|nr:uncharacterized protein FOA43_004645 [Brettanomyces nanus]QPG77238.1 hypothetical protein FOA43_004645 [Brettanomyces nanus]
MPTHIKLLTFNLWGLKYVSHHREERLHSIADRLANESSEDDYDIVALQEVWCLADWEYIDKVCETKYPYRRCFSSGMISGPGLAILSRFPIAETFIYRYPVNGRPSAFYRGDWYVGKSAAVTVLDVDQGKAKIAVVNSHMHAPYALTGDAAYSCHRAAQAWDLAQLAQRLTRQGLGVILVGDLNSRPSSLPYRILSNVGQLRDSWKMLHGSTDLDKVAHMSPEDQIKLAATTCDSILNTWRASRAPTEACRLDYALVGGNRLVPTDAGVVFTERIPNVGSYSDHFGYTATFELMDVVKQSLQSVEIDHSALLAVYDDLTELLVGYLMTTSQWQRKWRMWHFVLSMVVFIAFIPIIIVVSYRAPWSSVIFYVIGSIVAVTGVIDGLLSFLFGRNEQRAIKEVLMQVNDKRVYENSLCKHTK